MRRRAVLAGCVPLLGLGGCLEDQPPGDGGGGPVEGEGGGSEGGSDGGGDGDGEFYESGTMAVVVDVDPVDLAADRFQAEYADEDVRFHFHEGDENWHMERERVTFATAVDLLPRFAYARADAAHVVTVDGTTFDGGDPGVDVAFRVDGDPADPVDYEVRGGDHLVLEVTTDG